MMLPSGFTPASVTVKPPAVNTNWLFTRVVFALAVLPAIVAAPTADSVFTKVGATGFGEGTVVVVTGTVVVVDTAEPLATTRATVVVVTTTPGTVVVVIDGAITASPNVNSDVVVCAAYVSSPARVMVTTHLPAVVAVNTPFVIVHPAPPGDVTVYVTAPVPVPPVKLRGMPVPTVPVVAELSVPRTGVAFEKESVKVPDSERYVESDAFVTVSTHVPTARAETTPDVSEQFAEPVVTDIDTEPVPDPPVTDTMIPV
jgi:hypothetical protein